MKRILILVSYAILSQHLSAMEKDKISIISQPISRNKSFDATRDHNEVFPNTCELGYKTLKNIGQEYRLEHKEPIEIMEYNIGSDEDASRRWTLVAQDIIRYRRPDASPKNVDFKEQACLLLSALAAKDMSLKPDIMESLKAKANS